MPFTPAHIAAALPLRRLNLVWSGLVVGTMAPDFEYFLRLAPNDGYGHTLPGTFLLTLPLALLMLWLFHAFVKLPLVNLLPEGVRRRLVLGEFRFRGVARFTLVIVSVLVGIATHLAWDSFTHPNTWIYRRWPVLREPVDVLFFGPTPVYKALQHVSTVLGMGVLLIGLFLWYRRAEPSTEAPSLGIPLLRKGIILFVAMAIALAGAIIRAIVAVGIPANHLAEKRFMGLFVVTLIALLWWQFVLYGITRTKLEMSKPST
jgi:hypothetical protein